MTSDPTTWTDLKVSLANWLNRDDLSTTEIPEAIALFERRAQRTIFGPEREIVTDLTIDSEEESLPADLWGIKALHLSTDPRTVLEQMTLAVLRNSFSASKTGKPENYAIRGEKIVFGPAPDATYTGKLSYIQTIPALGSGQATNWLLTDHPDVYLHGALEELHLLLGDEARSLLHGGKREQLTMEINASSLRRTSGAAPIRIRAPRVV
jgi:hypothetical protein